MKCYFTFLHTCGSYNIGKWHTKNTKMKTQRIQGEGGTDKTNTYYYYLIFFSHYVWCSVTIATVSNKKARINENPFFVSTCHIPLVQKVAELEAAVARGQVLGETLYIKKRERRTIHSLASGTQRD